MNKIILCRCEDITLDDILEAIENGYDDLESLKRYTGIGTGLCQGKMCISNIVKILYEKLNLSPADMRTITQRPPIVPVAFGFFAGEETNE